LKREGRISRGQTGTKVDVEGPLGKMSMNIPPYMKIDGDESGRNYNLSILDAKKRDQREMWGS